MRALALLAALLCAWPAAAVTPAAAEFMAIVKQLEPVLCQMTKLRREILVAQTEHNLMRVGELRAHYTALERDPGNAKLLARLDALQPQITDANGRIRDAEDFAAITAQQREAYARCQ